MKQKCLRRSVFLVNVFVEKFKRVSIKMFFIIKPVLAHKGNLNEIRRRTNVFI